MTGEKKSVKTHSFFFLTRYFFFFLAGFLFLASAEAPAAPYENIGDGVQPIGEGQTVSLSLENAISLALRNNLLTRLARESIREAKGKSLQSISDLLPHIEAGISQQRTGKENLAALGFKGFSLIGPFNTFDARFRLTQKIFDLSAISISQAGRANVEIARYEEEFAKQKVFLIASLAYLETLQNEGELKAAKANARLAKRLFLQALHQHEAQIATGVDVARAETRVAEEKLRYQQARAALTETYLQLQRVAGLSFENRLYLNNALTFFEEPHLTIKSAVTTAEKNRLEMHISKDKIRAAKYLLRATQAQILPKIEASGDIGMSGIQPNKSDRLTGGALIRATMPIFEGGKIRGSIQEISSQKRQLEESFDDLKNQISEDVRLAREKVKTGREQVQTATAVLALAGRELKLANNRFAAGVGDNVEVISAQTTLARARDSHVTALTQYHIARINLYFALGKTESFYLKSNLQDKGDKTRVS